jgi:glutamate carboxypeptidase
MADPAPAPADVLAHLRERSSAMVDLLVRLVDLDSPSGDPERIAAVREVVADELTGVGFRPRPVRAASGVGDHLFARRPPRRDRSSRRDRPSDRCQLVLGHLDTVWPAGEATTRPAAVDSGELTGPGSFDMKAGVVQLVWALRCLRDLSVEPPAPVVVFLNSDEEVGSPDSRRWIEWLARLASRAFVLEGAFGPSGSLKVGRKGVGHYVVRAAGVAAHAGLDPSSGASAVLEISHQIQHLFALNDPERGITVNVGTVDGGLRPNVVAPVATAHVDVRVPTLADAARIDEALRRLCAVDPAVTVTVSGGFGRPPMEPNERNQRLWRRAGELAGELGLELDAAVVGGGSDGNLTSQHTATLDGLGAVGDGAHRLEERVRIGALAERTALLALLLASPLDPAEHPPDPSDGGDHRVDAR